MARVYVTVQDRGERLAATKFSDRELMRRIGLQLRERIIRRTKAGIDAEGRPFQSYSRSYAEQKAKALGNAGTVNLEVSGRMLQSLTLTEVTEDMVEIGLRD